MHTYINVYYCNSSPGQCHSQAWWAGGNHLLAEAPRAISFLQGEEESRRRYEKIDISWLKMCLNSSMLLGKTILPFPIPTMPTKLCPSVPHLHISDGDSTGQSVPILHHSSGKKFFLISKPNLPWLNMRPSAFTPVTVIQEKRPTPTSPQIAFRQLRGWWGLPWASSSPDWTIPVPSVAPHKTCAPDPSHLHCPSLNSCSVCVLNCFIASAFYSKRVGKEDSMPSGGQWEKIALEKNRRSFILALKLLFLTPHCSS